MNDSLCRSQSCQLALVGAELVPTEARLQDKDVIKASAELKGINSSRAGRGKGVCWFYCFYLTFTDCLLNLCERLVLFYLS